MIVASAPTACQEAAVSPLATASRTMPANAVTLRARTSANAGSAGVSAVRAARARPRNAAAPELRAAAAQQAAQHQRVHPQHHDHRRDGDQRGRGARVQVHPGPGLGALLPEDEDPGHRGEARGRLGDQPGRGARPGAGAADGGAAAGAATPR